jgi:hypothetical protein
MRWDGIPVQRISPAAIDLIKALTPHDCYIAGGYARWACSPRSDTPLPTDIDVVCPSKEQFKAAKKTVLTDGGEKLRDTKFSFTFSGYDSPLKIQLLKTFHGDTLEEALSEIDFSVCRVALITTYDGIADRNFLKDERASRLRVMAIEKQSVVNTFCRLLRYARKGYDISQTDITRVLKVIQNADIDESPALVDESISYRDVGS